MAKSAQTGLDSPLIKDVIKDGSLALLEIKELYGIVSKGSGTDKNLARIHDRLDYQTEEMNIDYQYKNNGIILMLTILSILVAIIAIQPETLLLSDKPWHMHVWDLPWYILLVRIVTVVVILGAIVFFNHWYHERKRLK